MAETLTVKVRTRDKLVIESTDQGSASKPKTLKIERHRQGKRNVDIYVSHGNSEEEIYLNTNFTSIVSDWLTEFLGDEFTG